MFFELGIDIIFVIIQKIIVLKFGSLKFPEYTFSGPIDSVVPGMLLLNSLRALASLWLDNLLKILIKRPDNMPLTRDVQTEKNINCTSFSGNIATVHLSLLLNKINGCCFIFLSSVL